MFVKIAAMVLMVIIATSIGEAAWNGFSAKWLSNDLDKDGFYLLPRSLKDAASQGWTEIPGVGAEHNMTAMAYYGDPRFVLLFAKCNGRAQGLQVGIPVADIANPEFPINYNANPDFTTKTLNGEDYYTATAYFYEDVQQLIRRIWVELDGKPVEIPTKPDLITRKTSYYLKRCVRSMGLHYYELDSTTDCTVASPWILLRVEDEIDGIAFQTIANPTTASKRTWFEDESPSDILATVPDAPACFSDGLKTYGPASIHVWFNDDPRTIVCKDECTAVYNSSGAHKQPHHHSCRKHKQALGSGNVCPV